MQKDKTSAWAPFSNPVYRSLWLATLVSNIGTWMHDIGAGWLMTSLTSSPVMVALVQTAATLPIFLLALPAGAFSDIVDRRRHLIAMQLFMAIIAALLAVIYMFGVITPWILITLTFGIGIGAAMAMPAWVSIVPDLVPRSELQSAIALNSMGINAARAIGPAMAGSIVYIAGNGAVFALNALSFTGVIWVLWRWQPETHVSQFPNEKMLEAMQAGIRYVQYSPEIRATILRGITFFIFASASWALLPLIAKKIPAAGPHTFGILVASIGIGALASALLLPRLRRIISRDNLVAGAMLIYATCLIALATLEGLIPLAVVMALSGVAWITVLSSLQISAQLALPNWVRSRGLAIFMSSFMGSMALGSLLWGKFADMLSINDSLIYAGIGMAMTLLLTCKWKTESMEGEGLNTSTPWQWPKTKKNPDRGPVLVTIQYKVCKDEKNNFIELANELASHRRLTGAYGWELFEDTDDPLVFLESFNHKSWLTHMRSHERVSTKLQNLQDQIKAYLQINTQPVIKHYLATDKV